MRKFGRPLALAGALLLVFLGAAPGWAQTQWPTPSPSQSAGGAVLMYLSNGQAVPTDLSTGLPINCLTGCSPAGGAAGNNADNVSPVSTGLGEVQSYGYLWDGAHWQRWPGDGTNGSKVQGTFWPYTLGQKTAANSVPVVLPSDGALPLPTGAATAANQALNSDTAALITLAAQGAGTVTGTDQVNSFNRGVQVGINLTTMTTASLVVHIQGKDVASGQYYDVCVGSALASTGFTNMTVYPGVHETANISCSYPLPKTWRVQVVVTGASAAATGTVGASLID